MISGIISIVICSVLLGTAPSLQNILLNAGYSVPTLNFLTNILETVILLIICRIRKQSLKVSGKQLLHLALCAVCGLGATGLILNYAYGLMPVGTVTMIHFLYPTVICLYTCASRQEKFTKLKALSIVLSIGGLALLCLGQSLGINKTGLALALCSTLTYGFYVTSNGMADLRDLDVTVKPFYIYLFATVFNGILCTARGGIILPSDGGIRLPMLVVIAACFSLAAICIAYSVKMLGAARTSFLNMLEPITSFIVSAVLFSDPVTVRIICGCVLILTSGCLIVLDKQKASK